MSGKVQEQKQYKPHKRKISNYLIGYDRDDERSAKVY